MDEVQRKAELEKLCANLDDSTRLVTASLIEEIAFLEHRLSELKQYPFLSVNPKNPVQQKPTYAAKQYKDFLQQYNNCIKILLRVLGKIESEELSPLRQYLEQLQERAGHE